MARKLSQFSINAVVPDQLIHYVRSITGLESRACGQCILHIAGDQGVLAAYPLNAPANAQVMNEAVQQALAMPELKTLTVLSAQPPGDAPENSQKGLDMYWALPLPLAEPKGKLKNMLKRAARDVTVQTATGKAAWTAEHGLMVEDFCSRKAAELDDASMFLFRHLGNYLSSSDDVVLFSAFNKDKLIACAVADFTAFSTAFYMFAFRSPAAVPGSADLLLYSICREAEKRGHSRVNLGLGIDAGVEFFKKKWGAEPWLPYVETSWPINRKSLLSRMFNIFSKK